MTTKAKITAIIFDADGVVIDSERIWDTAQTEFSQRHGLPYEREKLKPLLAGRNQIEAIELLKAEYGIAGNIESLAAERTELVKCQFQRGVEFVRGFREFFERIRTSHQTCIATAMPEELLALVDARLNLSQLFNGRLFSIADVGHRSKPNPDIFLHAARQLSTAPANCLVIEDAPHGIEAARRAGMRCVGLATTFNRQTLSRADCVVNSFTEIDLAEL